MTLGLRFRIDVTIDFTIDIWDFNGFHISQVIEVDPNCTKLAIPGRFLKGKVVDRNRTTKLNGSEWFMLLQCGRSSFRTQNKLIFFEIPGCVAFGRGD